MNVRLQKELELAKKSKDDSILLDLVDDNLNLWVCVMCGPENSPYEKGKFVLSISLPEEYPFKPPQITFETKVYHPSVGTNGEICLGILKDDWVPNLTI